MRALVLAFAACGGAPHVQPAPAPATAHAPLAWNRVGDTDWGVSIANDHFEIDRVRAGSSLELSDGRSSSVQPMAGPFGERATYEPAPELEALDREFAAKSAADGGAAWAAMFAPGGAEWSHGKRIESADVGAVMTRVLLGATMTWQPVASGKHDALGFTLGTYVLQSKNSAEHEDGSYCTIWHQQPDGSWKVVFDVGNATPN